jgi:hypothetical protein
VKLERGFNQAENIRKRLGTLFRDFGIALGLVIITLLPLGLRASAVVMISIPLSLLIGVTLLQAFGFTLNQLSSRASCCRWGCWSTTASWWWRTSPGTCAWAWRGRRRRWRRPSRSRWR